MSAPTTQPAPAGPIVFGDPQLHADGDLVSLAFAADGSLWSVEEPGVVRHWHTPSGRQLDHQQLSDLETLWSFSGDGRFLAAASNDLSVWEVASGRLLAALHQASWVTALAFAPEPTLMATGHDDGSVRLWDAAGKMQVRALKPHRKPVSAVSFSADGQRLASASESKSIVITRVSDGTKLAELTGHTDRIPQLLWHPNGRWLISAGWDTTARIWDVASGQPALLLNAHEGQAVALAISPDGQLLASADASGQVHLWRSSDWHRLHVLSTGGAEIRCLAFSLDGKHLACGGTDRRIHLWDTAKGTPLSAASAGPPVPTSVALSADGTRLVSNSGGRALRVWNVATRQPLLTLTDKEPIGAVGISPDGRWIAGAAGTCVRVWDSRSGRFHATLAQLEEPVTVLAFSPDSQTLAAASNQGTSVWLWTVAKAEPLLLIPDAIDGCTVYALAFHPKGKILAVGGVDWMATGGSDGTISFWDVAECCEVATFGGGTTAMAFHPSGERLVSATLDHALIVWDSATHDPVGEFEGHDASINCLSYSADGRIVASGSDDRTVCLWDADSGDSLGIKELDSQVKVVCFAPDGRHVFTGNANTTSYQIGVFLPRMSAEKRG